MHRRRLGTSFGAWLVAWWSGEAWGCRPASWSRARTMAMGGLAGRGCAGRRYGRSSKLDMPLGGRRMALVAQGAGRVPVVHPWAVGLFEVCRVTLAGPGVGYRCGDCLGQSLADAGCTGEGSLDSSIGLGLAAHGAVPWWLMRTTGVERR